MSSNKKRNGRKNGMKWTGTNDKRRMKMKISWRNMNIYSVNIVQRNISCERLSPILINYEYVYGGRSGSLMGCCSKLQPKMIRHGKTHWQFARGKFTFTTSVDSQRIILYFFRFFMVFNLIFHSLSLTTDEPSIWLSIMHAAKLLKIWKEWTFFHLYRQNTTNILY